MSISLLIPNWMRVLYMMDKGHNLNKISIKSGMTYSHTYKIVKHFEKKGLVEKMGKEGRRNVYYISRAGQKMIPTIEMLMELSKDYLDMTLDGYVFQKRLEQVKEEQDRIRKYGS